MAAGVVSSGEKNAGEKSVISRVEVTSTLLGPVTTRGAEERDFLNNILEKMK